VAVQGSGIKLGEDEDFIYPGVDAVGDGDINQAIFTTQGDCWLGAVFGQGVKPFTLPSAED
jgi:hypothetical protein